ncbi:MAG: 16S rRNA (adenine(1518)-N(6)/adenine(1519)-N(6))-dimethyltransferase RsmA [Pseudomonadota bacterium]
MIPRAYKSYGQHFLLNPVICREIVAGAGDLSKAWVVEVGPGPGTLTQCLIDSDARKIIAIEKDGRFIENIRSLDQEKLEVIHEDALVWLRTWQDPCPHRPLVMIANLPYNISTPLLITCLRRGLFDRLIITVQKEVADRLIAKVGSRNYSRLSVMAQWRAQVQRFRVLQPGAFTPPPKVRSAVVRMDVARADPLWATMEMVVAAGFSQRRKTLRASLRRLDPDGAHLSAAKIDPGLRAQNLTPAQFYALARRFAKTALPK